MQAPQQFTDTREVREEKVLVKLLLGQRQKRKKYRRKPPRFWRDCVKIKTKKGEVIPFVMNRAQVVVHEALEKQKRETGRVRALIPKARQLGVFYANTTLNEGRRTYILTHEDQATQEMFQMAGRIHAGVPDGIRAEASTDNANEMDFAAISSGYRIGTARTKAKGRGGTVQNFHGCLAEGTLVVDPLTARLREIETYRVGDLVRTHTNETAPISHISTGMKECVTLMMKGLTNFPLTLTNNHRLWTRTGWAKAGALDEGDVVGFPVREIHHDITHLPFRVEGGYRPQGGGSQPSGPAAVETDHNLGRVVGLYLAEGSIKRQQTGQWRPASVDFGVHEDEVERTIEWLQALGDCCTSIKARQAKDTKTVHVVSRGRSFAEFIEGLVGSTDAKRLPEYWWLMGKEFVRGMVHGYLSGDGHFAAKRDRRISATSIREAISIGMRDAIASLGYGWAAIAYKPPGIRYGREERPAYILRLTGEGVERLSQECGKPYVKRQRPDRGNYGTIRVEDGYAWMPIVSKVVAGMKRIFDFEVSHKDHSFCLLQGASHNSEMAYWANAGDHMAGVMQSIPEEDGTEVIFESTGAGIGNLFYDLCIEAMEGNGDFILIFLPWHLDDDYRRTPPEDWVPASEWLDYGAMHDLDPDQLYWAWNKNIVLDKSCGGSTEEPSWLFRQEYPATLDEAFQLVTDDSFIRPEIVLAARKASFPAANEIMPVILGVDVAHGGNDKTRILDRHGRRLGSLVNETWDESDEMVMAGMLAQKIDELTDMGRGPKAVNIDTTGGYGAGLADRLLERGYKMVNKINFGRRANNVDKHANMRAQMWDDLRAWLEDGADIPDDEKIQMHFCAPKSKPDSGGRLLLEAKEKIKKRLKFSPDAGDAAGLTFAVAVYAEPKKMDRYERAAAKSKRGSSWAA